MFAGKKSAQIREILISESAWEEMTCLFAPSLVSQCDGFYFGKESPTYQVELKNKYPTKALLLIAEQNPECVIGSAFCLIIKDEDVRFSVKMDSLSRSGVRVSPDVLMLARNNKHG